MENFPEENLETESLNQIPPISKKEEEITEIVQDLDDKVKSIYSNTPPPHLFEIKIIK